MEFLVSCFQMVSISFSMFLIFLIWLFQKYKYFGQVRQIGAFKLKYANRKYSKNLMLAKKFNSAVDNAKSFKDCYCGPTENDRNI